MARATSKATNGDDTEQDVTRISITVDPQLRRTLRIAAALADKTVGEFAVEVIRMYAEKQIKDAGV